MRCNMFLLKHDVQYVSIKTYDVQYVSIKAYDVLYVTHVW